MTKRKSNHTNTTAASRSLVRRVENLAVVTRSLARRLTMAPPQDAVAVGEAAIAAMIRLAFAARMPQDVFTDLFARTANEFEAEAQEYGAQVRALLRK